MIVVVENFREIDFFLLLFAKKIFKILFDLNFNAPSYRIYRAFLIPPTLGGVT